MNPEISKNNKLSNPLVSELFNLEGKTIIVTGASRGLGHGIALAFAKAGANLVLASRTLSALEELGQKITQIGREAMPVVTDVTNEFDVEKLVKSTISKFGSIDVLLNNAGITISGLLAEDVTESQFDSIMATNLKGMFLCGTAVAKVMISKKQGKIINMSSVLGVSVWAKASIYCTSKAALNQLTKTWAVEWAPYNVTVNALSPSFITTPLNKHLLEQKDYRQRVLNHLPIGRIGEISDVIGSAIFLASEASNYMTGHVLVVDGGWTCL